MVRRSPSICLAIFVGALSVGSADARNRPLPDSNSLTPIVEASPTLAPFQHVRFCLRYPSDCKSNPTENERIDLDAQTTELRIPIYSGRVFRREAGHRSDLKPATIPK